MKLDSLSLTVTEGDDAELTEVGEMNCHATNVRPADQLPTNVRL